MVLYPMHDKHIYLLYNKKKKTVPRHNTDAFRTYKKEQKEQW